MRLLYGVNTNGQGHINRARNLIWQFQQDGHEVDILFSGHTPPRYAHRMAKRTSHLNGVQLAYQNHIVHVPKTMFKAMSAGINAFTPIKRVEKTLKSNRYDAIFSDQEPYVSIFGAREQLPTIFVDHQHSLLHPASYSPNIHVSDKLSALLAIKLNTVHKDFAYGLDYTEDIIQVDDIVRFPLVEKVDLFAHRFEEEDFIVVYFNKSSLREVVRFLRSQPKIHFKVYGFDKKLTFKNIEFKRTSRKEFTTDLMKCKGIISSAGFSLTWEGIQLDKPMYLIPQKFQYEQFVNVMRLDKLNYIIYSEELDLETLDEFLTSFIDEFHSRRKKLKVYPLSLLTKHVYSTLKSLNGGT